MHLLLSSKCDDHHWSVTLVDVDTDEVKYSRSGRGWWRAQTQRRLAKAYNEAKALAGWLELEW